jgi:hypothetical protein
VVEGGAAGEEVVMNDEDGPSRRARVRKPRAEGEGADRPARKPRARKEAKPEGEAGAAGGAAPAESGSAAAA